MICTLFQRGTYCPSRVVRFIAVMVISWLCLMMAGCGGQNGAPEGKSLTLKYASLLRIDSCGGYRLVRILDPWKQGSTLHLYALIDSGNPIPKDIPEGATVLTVPLHNLCVSTSVHVNLMKQLGALGDVKSICEGQYILSDSIRSVIHSGRIKDVGSALNPSVERIVGAGTDALLLSPFEGAGFGALEKTGIPIVQCADYMETSALGRAEWMKFYGMLVGKEAAADSLFRGVEKNYLHLKSVAANAKARPKLLVDMLNGNTWYMAGGRSIYGQLYRDCGADYSVASPDVSGSEAMSLEKVMSTALNADVWIVKYGRSADYTLSSFSKENTAYPKFKALKEGRVYGCNTQHVPFYDEVPFRPDRLMQDIIRILHPGLLPQAPLNYYSRME